MKKINFYLFLFLFILLGCKKDNDLPNGNGIVVSINLVQQIENKIKLKGSIKKLDDVYQTEQYGFFWSSDKNRVLSELKFEDLKSNEFITSGSYNILNSFESFLPDSLFLKNKFYYFKSFATSKLYHTFYPSDSLYSYFFPHPRAPEIKTDSASEVSDSKVRLWGNLVSKKGGKVIERGFCFSNSNSFPTIDDSKHLEQSLDFQEGSYSMSIQSLIQGQLYRYRSYAKTDSGYVNYGDVRTFLTISNFIPPQFELNNAKNINPKSLTLNFTISGLGSLPILESGIVWDVSPNPTINSNVTNLPFTIGTSDKTITNLEPQKKYYFRFFAKDLYQTYYSSNELICTTDSLWISRELPEDPIGLLTNKIGYYTQGYIMVKNSIAVSFHDLNLGYHGEYGLDMQGCNIPLNPLPIKTYYSTSQKVSISLINGTSQSTGPQYDIISGYSKNNFQNIPPSSSNLIPQIDCFSDYYYTADSLGVRHLDIGFNENTNTVVSASIPISNSNPIIQFKRFSISDDLIFFNPSILYSGIDLGGPILFDLNNDVWVFRNKVIFTPSDSIMKFGVIKINSGVVLDSIFISSVSKLNNPNIVFLNSFWSGIYGFQIPNYPTINNLTDNNGNIWLAFNYGVNENKLYKLNNNTSNSINIVPTTSKILCLSKANDGNIWIGTDNGMVYLINYNTNAIINSYNVTQLFGVSSISSIVCSPDGSVYFISQSKIARFKNF